MQKIVKPELISSSGTDSVKIPRFLYVKLPPEIHVVTVSLALLHQHPYSR